MLVFGRETDIYRLKGQNLLLLSDQRHSSYYSWSWLPFDENTSEKTWCDRTFVLKLLLWRKRLRLPAAFICMPLHEKRLNQCLDHMWCNFLHRVEFFFFSWVNPFRCVKQPQESSSDSEPDVHQETRSLSDSCMNYFLSSETDGWELNWRHTSGWEAGCWGVGVWGGDIARVRHRQVWQRGLICIRSTIN